MSPQLILAITLFAVGCWLGSWISSGRQQTYFEANNIANYFYNNPREGSVEVEKIYDASEWSYICIGNLASYTLPNPPVPIQNEDNRLIRGYVNEGLLDYLGNFSLVNAGGFLQILNFDERRYRITAAKAGCIPLDAAIILRSVELIAKDPDGADEVMITLTLKSDQLPG